MSYRHLLENRWAENNVQYDRNEQKLYYMWNYITCGISISILAHSFILHGRKYESVRACTDLACILGIIPAFSTAAASVHPDLLKTVIANQIINYSFCGLLLRGCDLQMFLSRYCVIQRVSLQQQKVHYMVGWGLYVGYVLIWTVSPCWLDANSTSFYPRIVFLSSEGVVVIILIAYILFFTWMSVRVILSLNRWERRRQKYPWHPLLGLLDSSGISTFKATEKTVTPVGYCNRIPLIMRNVGSLLCLRGLLGSVSKIKPLDEDHIISNIPEEENEAQLRQQHQQLLQQQISKIDKNQIPIDQESAVIHKKIVGDGDAPQRGLQSAVFRWRLKVVARKSVLHAIISIAGLVMAISSPETFNRTLGLQTVVTLHFLFNWRIEDIIWPMKSSGVSKGRESREFHAIKQLRKRDRIERIESSPSSGNGAVVGYAGIVTAVADRCKRQIKNARSTAEAAFIARQVEIMCRRRGLLVGDFGHMSSVMVPVPSNKIEDEKGEESGGSSVKENEAEKVAGEWLGKLELRSPAAVDAEEGGRNMRFPNSKEEEGKSWD